MGLGDFPSSRFHEPYLNERLKVGSRLELYQSCYDQEMGRLLIEHWVLCNSAKDGPNACQSFYDLTLIHTHRRSVR